MSTQEIRLFDPKESRTEIVKELSALATYKYISLPDDFKETIFHAVDKMSSLNDIEKVEQSGISKALIRMFRDNLDYTKNHCYFFVQKDINSPTGKSLRFGLQYQGKIHVAKTKYGVVDVIPVLRHSKDEFEMKYDNGRLVIEKHIPTFEGDIVGGYCIVDYGGKKPNYIKYYTKQELDLRKSKSQKLDGEFWKVWQREMYEKTLIHATLTRLIESDTENTLGDLLYTDEEDLQITKGRVVDDAVIVQDEPTEKAKPKSTPRAKVNQNTDEQTIQF